MKKIMILKEYLFIEAYHFCEVFKNKVECKNSFTWYQLYNFYEYVIN